MRVNGFLVWLGWRSVDVRRTSSRYFTIKKGGFVVSLHSRSVGQNCTCGVVNESYSNSYTLHQHGQCTLTIRFNQPGSHRNDLIVQTLGNRIPG